MGYHVVKLLESRQLNENEIAQTLGMTPTDVSHLMNGHFSHFTIEKLFECLRCLDQKVVISIKPRQKGEPYQEVSFQ
jgi:predicted XRE-type DNA-binding protein